MKKLISLFIIFTIIMLLFSTVSYGKVRTSGGVRAKTSTSIKSSTSSKSTSTKSSGSTTKSTTKASTIKGVKDVGSYKTFTSKYNNSNIKTEKVNTNPTNYTNYNTTSIFRPNAWTAMWLFTCMNNNSNEVTEQDIAKELEERGYTQDEIKEILEEGKMAQEEDKKIEAENAAIDSSIGIIVLVVLGILLIALFVILWKV